MSQHAQHTHTLIHNFDWTCNFSPVHLIWISISISYHALLYRIHTYFNALCCFSRPPPIFCACIHTLKSTSSSVVACRKCANIAKLNLLNMIHACRLFRSRAYALWARSAHVVPASTFIFNSNSLNLKFMHCPFFEKIYLVPWEPFHFISSNRWEIQINGTTKNACRVERVPNWVEWNSERISIYNWEI